MFHLPKAKAEGLCASRAFSLWHPMSLPGLRRRFTWKGPPQHLAHSPASFQKPPLQALLLLHWLLLLHPLWRTLSASRTHCPGPQALSLDLTLRQVMSASLLALTIVKVKVAHHVWLFATPWIVAHQAPLSTGFSRQEYWSQLPFPSSRDLPNQGIEPRSPGLQADSLQSETPGKSRVCGYL